MTEGLIALGVIALCILLFFIIQTLMIAQASLRRLDVVLLDAEFKLRKLTSLVNTVDNLSEIAEKETEKLKVKYLTHNINEKDTYDSGELASWLISSIKLGLKIFKRR